MIGAVRKAGMRDIAPLLELINGYAAKGIMLPRTEFEMSENIRDFGELPLKVWKDCLRCPKFECC